jgi:hypothetical protein
VGQDLRGDPDRERARHPFGDEVGGYTPLQPFSSVNAFLDRLEDSSAADQVRIRAVFHPCSVAADAAPFEKNIPGIIEPLCGKTQTAQCNERVPSPIGKPGITRDERFSAPAFYQVGVQKQAKNYPRRHSRTTEPAFGARKAGTHESHPFLIISSVGLAWTSPAAQCKGSQRDQDQRIRPKVMKQHRPENVLHRAVKDRLALLGICGGETRRSGCA